MLIQLFLVVFNFGPNMAKLFMAFREMIIFSKQDTVAVHFFHVFSLFSSKQGPYMHPSAELYITASDVHPSLAKQITLFSLLRGIKNLEKPKKTKKTK